MVNKEINTEYGRLLYTASGDGYFRESPSTEYDKKLEIDPNVHLSDCGLVGRAALHFAEISSPSKTNAEPINTNEVAT